MSQIMTDEQLSEIMEIKSQTGLTWDELAIRLMNNGLQEDLTGEALRGRVKRFRQRSGMLDDNYDDDVQNEIDESIHGVIQKYKGVVTEDDLDYVAEMEDLLETLREEGDHKSLAKYAYEAKIQRLENEIRSMKKRFRIDDTDPEASELVYAPYPPYLDDTGEWEQRRAELLTDNEWVSVLVGSDYHIPDHSGQAIKLLREILREIQPDIQVYAGDVFDFDALGKYASKVHRYRRDALKEVERTYKTVVTRDYKASPHTVRIMFQGNHEARREIWYEEDGRPFSDTIEEKFVEVVRADGKVLWLPRKQETKIGGLLVQHGKRYGKYAAKNALEDVGNISQGQGHAHFPTLYYKRLQKPHDQLQKAYRIVTSFVAGTLSNIPPHYQDDTSYSSWIHGCYIAHVKNDMETVNIQPIIFQRDDSGVLWAIVGNRILRSNGNNEDIT